MRSTDVLNEVIDSLIEIGAADPEALEAAALFKLVTKAEKLTSQVMALSLDVRAAAVERKLHRQLRQRSMPLSVAQETRNSRGSCTRRLNHAHLLTTELTAIRTALQLGALNAEQVDLICRTAGRPKVGHKVGDAQDYFIGLGNRQWPDFRKKIEDWVEAMDDTDPQDEDEKAHLDRRFVWGQGLGKTVLAELAIPNDMFEQILAIVQPVYDAMFKQEWRDAKAAQDEDLEPGLGTESQVTFTDLARTDRQRWLDALFLVIRAGGAATKKLRLTTGEAGFEDDINLGDLDPGVLAQVVIVCDQETVEREISRQNGETLEPRSSASLSNYRCETLSGLPVTPSTALKTLHVGHFRRMTMKPGDLDFTVSRLARFFTGAKRLGLQVRDRHCAFPACGARIANCEGDHMVEHTAGGETIPTNGQMLCGPCHRHKTWLQARGHWEPKSAPDRPRRPSLVGHD